MYWLFGQVLKVVRYVRCINYNLRYLRKLDIFDLLTVCVVDQILTTLDPQAVFFNGKYTAALQPATPRKEKQRKNNSLVHFWVCNILSCLLLTQSNQFLHKGVSCAPLIRSWTLITGSRCIQDYFFMGLSFHLSPYSLVDFVCYLAWLSFFKPPWWPVSTFCAQIALNFQINY